MREQFPHHLHEIINEAQVLLSTYYRQNIHFSKIIQLSETDRRNLILRLVINNSTIHMPRTVILKKTAMDIQGESEAENTSRFARDWAGIEFLTHIGGHYAPSFYAGSLQHKFILIEDLGETHTSLVGPLTRAPSSLNRQKAIEDLGNYVRTLGKMHADTAGKGHVFNNLLKKIYSKTQNVHIFPENNIEYILEQFKKLIDLNKTNALRLEIQAIHEFVQATNDFNVLLHGDICPDNVYFQDNQMRLIDFEYGDFGNALIDGVYLRMCMPSCWCAKSVPSDVLIKMEAIYREELKDKIVLAADDVIYHKNLVFACAYWVIRCIKILDEFELLDREMIGQNGPLEPDSLWEPEKNASRPRILSRLKAFIAIANEHDLLPNFRTAATKLLTHLKQIWPETDFIELYPVFREKTVTDCNSF